MTKAFHPNNHLPGCMMPDGGECCPGHAAVCEDWHKQRATISRLTAEMDAAKGALEGVSAFVGIMFGKGPAAAIPETVTCPLGFEIKLGEIMRKAETALATTSDTDANGAPDA